MVGSYPQNPPLGSYFGAVAPRWPEGNGVKGALPPIDEGEGPFTPKDLATGK